MHRLAQMILAMGAAFIVSPVWGQASQDSGPATSGDALYQTIKSMQEEMERLRSDNDAMKGQIDDLRAQTQDNWLTEARAREIRGLVEEVLADSDARASLMNDGIMAGWSEHFFLADAFGRFLLEIEGMTQIRFIYNYIDQTGDRSRYGFENARTRLTFRGHVFNDWEYMIRGEFNPHPPPNQQASDFSLLDAWVRYHLTTDWSVRAGQFKLPFNREELVSTTEQLAVERSNINEAMSLGRSVGIEIAYHDDANSFALAFSNGMSNRNTLMRVLMGGPQTSTSAIAANVEYAFTARYERLLAGTWSQFSDFTSPIDEEYGMLFGIAGHAQNNESSTTQIIGESEPRSFSATTDLSIEWGGANAFVAAIYHYVDSPTFQLWNILGVVAQAGVYITPKWEAFARVEYGTVDNFGGGNNNVHDYGALTFGANYYIEGHDVKWTTDVGIGLTPVSSVGVPGTFSSERTGWRDVEATGLTEVVFRTQLQLLF